MTIDALLDRLDGVRQTGAGRFMARCPAHADRNPSLSIRALDDGRVLLHCFAGCEVADVVGAVGLTISDLFPPRALTATALASRRLELSASEALLLLGHEITAAVLLVDALAAMLRAGEIPNNLALDRLLLAAGRIQGVRNVTVTERPAEIRALLRGAR